MSNHILVMRDGSKDTFYKVDHAITSLDVIKAICKAKLVEKVSFDSLRVDDRRVVYPSDVLMFGSGTTEAV